jgi:hypothetical protein
VSFNSVDSINEIRDMLLSIVGLEVHVGVPESYSTTTTAVLTFGGQRVYQKTVGSFWQRDARFFVGFCYAVEGAEETAELAIGNYVDELIRKVIAKRNELATTGQANNVTLEVGLGDTPDYQAQLGVEVRVYPAVITVTQQEQIG